MIRAIVIFAALALAGCQTDQTPVPVSVTVQGPQFAASAFQCGRSPAPPDPTSAAGHTGSAAAHYETGLLSWGHGCQRKLKSVGTQLRSAGQVVDPAK